jgi:hypothetical protein
MMLGTVGDMKVVIFPDRNLKKHVARHFPHLSHIVRRWAVLYLMIRISLNLDLKLDITMPGLLWKILGHVQKLTILWYLERYQTIRGSKPLTVIKKLNNAQEQYKHSWISSILSSFSRRPPALNIIFCHYAECRSPLSCRHELHGQYWHRSPNLVQVWCYHRS